MFRGLSVSVCFFVCMLAKLLTKFSTDFVKILGGLGVLQGPSDYIWWRSGSRPGSRVPLLKLRYGPENLKKKIFDKIFGEMGRGTTL